MGSLCSKGVNEAAAATSCDVYFPTSERTDAQSGIPVRNRPKHPHFAELPQAPKSGVASRQGLEASSRSVIRLQDLPFDVLERIGQYVAPRDAYALSHASGRLRQVVSEQSHVHLATTLGNIQLHRRREVCDHLLNTLSKFPENRRHVVLSLLAEHFALIPDGSDRIASARCLWDAAIKLPVAHRGDVIGHLNVGWFPSRERAERLGELIADAAPLYQTKQVPEYDQMYRTNLVYSEDYWKSEEVYSLRTPLWLVKAQIYMLPIGQRGAVRARIRQLEGEVTNTVERLFPRPADQFENTNRDSISYAIELMSRGFYEHEAGYLAGVSDLSPLHNMEPVFSTSVIWRTRNKVRTLIDFVRAHTDGRLGAFVHG